MKVYTAIAAFATSVNAFTAPLARPYDSTLSMSVNLGPPGFGVKVQPDPKPTISNDDFAYGLPGAVAPFEDGWDPLNIASKATKQEMFYWREAELQHGRVAMLAATAFIVQEAIGRSFAYPPSFADVASVDMIPQLREGWQIVLGVIAFALEGTRVNDAWVDPRGPVSDGPLFKKNLFKLKADHYPGDYSFDPLGLAPKDADEMYSMQNKELQNGRLAMIGAIGLLAQEAVTHQPWSSVYQGLELKAGLGFDA